MTAGEVECRQTRPPRCAYRRLDALVALVRLQDGVEHICDTGQPLLGVICLLDESFIDALLRLVVGAADQSLE